MQKQLKTNLGKVFITTEYDTEEKWIYANWIGFISVDNVKKGAEVVLNEVKTTHCHALLNDNREVVGSWDKANEWLEAYWMPEASDAGLRYMALVLAPGIAAALSAQDMHSRKNGYFEMMLFGDVDKAKKWLRDSLRYNNGIL